MNFIRTSLLPFVYLLTLFLLPTQCGKHFWPSFSLVLGTRVDYLSPTLFLTDLLILLLCFGVWFTNNKHQKKEHSQLPFFIQWLINNKLLVACVLLVLFRIPFSQRPILGVLESLRLVEIGLFAWITVVMMQRGLRFISVAYVFAAGLVLQSVLAIAQFYNQGSINGIFYFLGERTFTSTTPGIANAALDGVLVLRPYGTLPHPNVLAGYLLVGLTFFFAIMIKKKLSGVTLLIHVLLTGILSIALLLTLSRSAIVVGIFSLCVFLVLSFRTTKALRHIHSLAVGSLLCGIIALSLFLLFPPLVPRFTQVQPRETAVVQRVQLMEASYHILADNMYWGIGLKHFLVVLPSYQNLLKLPVLVQPVHTIFVLWIVETGLPGLVILFIFSKKLINQIASHPTQRKYLETILAFIIIGTGLLDHYWLTVQQGRLLLAFCVGLIFIKDKHLFRSK